MTTNHDTNTIAREGLDRCHCGSKYYANDACIDCHTHVLDVEVETYALGFATVTGSLQLDKISLEPLDVPRDRIAVRIKMSRADYQDVAAGIAAGASYFYG